MRPSFIHPHPDCCGNKTEHWCGVAEECLAFPSFPFPPFSFFFSLLADGYWDMLIKGDAVHGSANN